MTTQTNTKTIINSVMDFMFTEEQQVAMAKNIQDAGNSAAAVVSESVVASTGLLALTGEVAAGTMHVGNQALGTVREEVAEIVKDPADYFASFIKAAEVEEQK